METSIKRVLNGVKVEFYLLNGRYTVRVNDNEAATEKLLAACKHKSVRADKLHFYIRGIKEKIEAGVLNGENCSFENVPINENPIIQLGELVQKKYGENMGTEVINKTGADHCPQITVKITLPTGDCEIATAGNQREAKKIAAKKLLERIK
jgi:dsRNA-specific ribonuclease